LSVNGGLRACGCMYFSHARSGFGNKAAGLRPALMGRVITKCVQVRAERVAGVRNAVVCNETPQHRVQRSGRMEHLKEITSIQYSDSSRARDLVKFRIDDRTQWSAAEHTSRYQGLKSGDS